MRRDERCVSDLDAIYDILNRCDTVRLGFCDGKIPYVVPMTFGCTIENGKIAVYFHCATAGRKWDILAEKPVVCVEADLYYKTVHLDNGHITAQYESVIGTGTALRIEDREEKVKALQVILEHYRESGFPAQSCKGLSLCEVFRIELDEVCGKRNL